MERRYGSRLLPPQLAALGASCLILILLAVGFAVGLGPVDDAYITYRCAQNFAAGDGPVFNPGERVETSTAGLFTLVLGGLHALTGLEFQALALALNAAALWLMLFLLLHTALEPPPDRRTLGLRGLALAYLVFTPPTFHFLFNGMDTVFFAGFSFAGFFLAWRYLRVGRGAVWAGLLLGLAAAVRLEAGAFAVGTAAVLLIAQPRQWRASLTLLGAAAAVVLPVELLRLAYFGVPFPHSYYIKVDGGNLDLLVRGARYAGSWFRHHPATALLAAAAGLGALRARREPATLLPAAWVVGYLGYVAAVGGDYFPDHRFLLPMAPVLALVGVVELPRLRQLTPTRRRIAVTVLVLAAVGALVMPAGWSQRTVSWRSQQANARAWAQIGRVIGEGVPHEASLFLTQAGAIPFFSGLRAFDSMGLSGGPEPKMKKRLGRGMAGHETSDYGRVHLLWPDLILLISDDEALVAPKVIRVFCEAQRAAPSRSPNLKRDMSHIYPNDFSLRQSNAVMRGYRIMVLRHPELQPLFLVRRTSRPAIRAVFDPVCDQDKSPAPGE
jgi:arabinofuranosyltransferase